jgi:hypothetical protein
VCPVVATKRQHHRRSDCVILLPDGLASTPAGCDKSSFAGSEAFLQHSCPINALSRRSLPALPAGLIRDGAVRPTGMGEYAARSYECIRECTNPDNHGEAALLALDDDCCSISRVSTPGFRCGVAADAEVTVSGG